MAKNNAQGDVCVRIGDKTFHIIEANEPSEMALKNANREINKLIDSIIQEQIKDAM